VNSDVRRLAALVAGVAALAIAAATLPLAQLPQQVANFGVGAPIAAVAVGAALLVALVPRTPISLACGVLFGAVTGAICALAAALVAAAVTFAAGRWLGREVVARRTGRLWTRLEGWIDREGVLAVAAVRALPIGPYGLTGYAYGASGVRVRDYTIGSIIAGAPAAIAYAVLGAALVTPSGLNPVVLVPTIFAAGLWLAIGVRRRRARAAAVPPATAR
jgi:uncharacterized membrane protein YdjX (TVP38/TMEM64 family)